MERVSHIRTLRELSSQLDLDAAWQKVLASSGMPGVDGISVRMFEDRIAFELPGLRRAVCTGAYRPLPARMLAIGKPGGGGSRICMVPAVGDRVLQSAAARLLDNAFEKYFENSSFANRSGRGVHAALRRIRELQQAGFRWVLRADVRGFFDSIEHELLLTGLSKHLGESHPLLSLISKWLAVIVWDGERLLRVAKGVPQGSPLSPVLSNFFLTPFDRLFRKGPFRLVRYGDDFTVLARDPAELGTARQLAEEMLQRLQLSLNLKKTTTASFGDGFRFIGARMETDATWVRFEPNRSRKPPVWAAPPMPASLLKAYVSGALHPCADFEPAAVQLNVDEGYTSVERRLPFDRLRSRA